MKECIVVFGATSGIARAVARELDRRGHGLVLAGREREALEREAADLAVRTGRTVPVFTWDLLERDRHPERFAALTEQHAVTGVFFAAGVMPDENLAATDPDTMRRLFDTNLTEPIVVLDLFARHFKDRGRGLLAVISSVAGDRGRASNRAYGATKAGLSTWLEGLRSALHGTGVQVTTIKPGPVRTPMTAGYKGPGFLLANPEKVARTIVAGIESRRTTVYAPRYWCLVMAVIRVLPEFLARKVPG